MRYRIEYVDGRCCHFVDSRAELIDFLKYTNNAEIEDIRKIYKSGVTDSIMDKCHKFVEKRK